MKFATLQKPNRGRLLPATKQRQPLRSVAPSSLSHPLVQAKLRIGPPNDAFEKKADCVAERVMRMPEPPFQRACACGGRCPKCRTEQPDRDHPSVKTKRFQASDTGQMATPPIVHEVLRSAGQPLDSSTRAYFEPRFAHDFSQVRIHVGEAAARSAQAVNARAYAVGRDVVFGAGQYRPEESGGRTLLAHELTHVCQQSAQLTPSVQRQEVLPPTSAAPSDAVVQKHIDGALTAQGHVLDAWVYLRNSRCLPQNCGDVNLAAAEHYMFARHLVEDSPLLLPPDVMLPIVLAAVVGYSLWKLGFEVVGRHAPPLFCPQACLVTPASAFQVRWGSNGAMDGNLATFNRGPVK